MPTNCPVQADAMQSALVYRRAFEDKWFSIESSDEDEADEQPASVDTDAAAAAERHLRRRRHQAHMLRDIGALNFCQSLASEHASTATCYQLQSDLARYERVTNRNNSHLYLDDCLQLLQLQCPDSTLADWRARQSTTSANNLDEFTDRLERLPCAGAHLDCNAEELQPDEVKQLMGPPLVVTVDENPTTPDGCDGNAEAVKAKRVNEKRSKKEKLLQLSQVFVSERATAVVHVDVDERPSPPSTNQPQQQRTVPSRTTQLAAPPNANAVKKVHPLDEQKLAKTLEKVTAIPSPSLPANAKTVGHFEWSSYTANSQIKSDPESPMSRPNPPSKWQKYVSNTEGDRFDDDSQPVNGQLDPEETVATFESSNFAADTQPNILANPPSKWQKYVSNTEDDRIDDANADSQLVPEETVAPFVSSNFAADTQPSTVPNPPSKWQKYVANADQDRCADDYTAESQCDDASAAKRARRDANVADTDRASQSAYAPAPSEFKTAREQLLLSERQRNERAAPPAANVATVAPTPSTTAAGPVRKLLGSRRPGVQSKFVSPVMRTNSAPAPAAATVTDQPAATSSDGDDAVHPRLKHIEPKMVELIRSEIMHTATTGPDQRPIGWDDIAGLQYAKQTIREAVVWPMLRPDIFTGLRRPPRGILLFGPPGTGKTLIGKCIAAQSKSTFFAISASSLTSKWIGDGEKMVRALFAVAAVHQPAVIFIDEIDSLLSQRSDTEHESSRRLKTEFLVQLDGAATADDERILIVGATNRPQELDEAARRRLVKRLYVPLPDREARQQLLDNLLRRERHELSAADVAAMAAAAEGFSGADMRVLCQEASMGPIRAIGSEQMEAIDIGAVRAVALADFEAALRRVRSSVSPDDLAQYVRWDETYGSGAGGRVSAAAV